MKPIKVYQCKGDCCVVRVPSKRFWYVESPKGQETWSSFAPAIWSAQHAALQLPHEVTA